MTDTPTPIATSAATITALDRPAPPTAYRWLVLATLSLAMLGSYYLFDALYAVTPLLKAQLGFTDQQVGLLDSGYSLVALLALAAGGSLVDRLGTARSAILFGLLQAAGGVLVALLPAVFPGAPAAAMIVGRMVLGLGGELLVVTANTAVGRWFKGQEISFAVAIQLLISRIGSAAADRSPSLAGSLFTSWQPPLLLAAGMGIAALALAAVYAALERRAASRDELGARVDRPDRRVPHGKARLGRSFVWVVGLAVTFYAAVLPFRTFANLYFIQVHGATPAEAGDLKAWLPTISIIGMPLFGLLADRFRRRAPFMVTGTALLFLAFPLMTATSVPLWVPVGMLGMAFALVPAMLTPSVTRLVPEVRLGSAFARMSFCQQAGWAAMSWGVGALNDLAGASRAHPGGWLPAMGLLGSSAAAGLVFSCLLWREERRLAAASRSPAAPIEGARRAG